MFNTFKSWLQGRKNNEKTDRAIFGIMLAAGLVALTAAFTLTVNKFEVLQNPDVALACSINLVLDCSTVMSTWQSELFGFPNMVIGLMAFSVVVTVALAGLAGVKFPRWWLIAANIGFLLGVAFSYWLFFQSVYVIAVLCPWCLFVTLSTTLIFSSMLHYNLKHNTFALKKKLNERVQRFLTAGYHQMIVLAWLALMAALVIIQFGNGLFI